MDFSWLAEPTTWIGFATLLILEVVLGIDNLVFVAILANKVKPAYRDKARITGLSLAIVMRIVMLAFMAHIMTLTHPWFYIGSFAVSGKDLIMLLGGLFLLIKPPPSCMSGWKDTINFMWPIRKKNTRRFGGWCCRFWCWMRCFPSIR